MLQGATYWFWIGTFYLMILTFKDYKNNMRIDDRHNFFMMGSTFALLSHVNRPLWFLVVLIGLSIALNYYINKYNLVGGADASTLTWLFYGYGILNPVTLLYFFGYFGAIALFYMFLKKLGLKFLKLPHNTPTPFYIVILISFLSFNLINGFY